MKRLSRNDIYANNWLKLFEDSVYSDSRGYEKYSVVEIIIHN